MQWRDDSTLPSRGLRPDRQVDECFRRSLGVHHVIRAIPACPVRPKSGHSAAGSVYEDTRLPIAGKQLLPAATTSARGAATCAHSVGDSLPVAGLAVLEFAKTLHQIEELAVDLNWINCRPAMEPLAPTSGVGGAPLLKSDGFLNHGPSVVA